MQLKDEQAGGEVWVWGQNPVMEALRAGRALSVVYISGARKDAGEVSRFVKTKGVPVKIVGRDFFEGRFDKGHQGIAALALPRAAAGLDEIIGECRDRGVMPFFLVLDGIEDPRNFGAILRVADAAGVHGVVFQTRRSAGITPVVSKASAGAVEHVALVNVVNIKHALRTMKEEGITVIGAEASATMTFWDADMKGPVAFVVGSEGQGLRLTVREQCDVVVSLPMAGKVNSLNVSVATGIMAYELVRQRREGFRKGLTGF